MWESLGGLEELGKECRIFLILSVPLPLSVTMKGCLTWCLEPCDLTKTVSPGEMLDVGATGGKVFFAGFPGWMGSRVAESLEKWASNAVRPDCLILLFRLRVALANSVCCSGLPSGDIFLISNSSS